MLGETVKPQPPWRSVGRRPCKAAPGGCRGCGGEQSLGPREHPRARAEGKGPGTPTCFSVGGKACVPAGL